MVKGNNREISKKIFMLIGELASKSGLSRDTIRYYEKIGLIKVSRSSRRPNNYKDYSEDVLSELLLIKKGKQVGFTLREIGDLLLLKTHDLVECNRVDKLVEQKKKQIQQKVTALMETHRRLQLLKSSCNGDCLAALQSVV